MYLFAHGVGNTRYRNICKHYDTHGFTPRRHTITGRCAANALSLNDERHVINFITTFADCNAMSLPGRMPKMKDYTVRMLPSDVTKANLWRTYTRACGDLSSKAVRLTKFKNIWKLYLPHNVVMKRISSDLCDTCQQNIFFWQYTCTCSRMENIPGNLLRKDTKPYQVSSFSFFFVRARQSVHQRIPLLCWIQCQYNKGSGKTSDCSHNRSGDYS